MSIDTLTGDEFAQLTKAEHEEALNLYDLAVSKTIEEATPLETDFERFAQDRDKLSRLLTLRKVHQVRLDELEGEGPVPRLMTQQYFDNELSDLPS